ncbi:SubName: Full=Uncharacterized protein {ECO:0000313/EMBL:CCA70616.1} [Serendipita indica DSM 11827]|uniref:Vacuole protein n=1 Tax=Serendipita indica (strain DSM 11827) TaxID=1109443 RepID=G4TH17_SERID|nr:SubName: Full=Uncharacterized protein {ECO:0000313/EMBL:CCA70616.1} [Serendipita indica DSM 11827]CCA70616.1 hypothetical protein PIIN_04553 [Serendipita indica DSM 11827]
MEARGRSRSQGKPFDFIDTREFHSKSFSVRLQYVWVYILVIKSFLVYISDIYTATTMLTSDKWSNKIFDSCTQKEGCVAIPFSIAKWLFVGCIIFSFLLLAYEARKSKKIIASRDISFAFTNVMAQNYYSLRSYDHFCLFCHINDSTKKKDDFAFFIFFTFKEWKRLLLADGPRQTINALTLYSFYLAKRDPKSDWWDLKKYFDSNDMVTNGLLVAIVFTVLIFLGSLLLLIIAAILYVPLLCYIRGNLKEYCCHKVDKRIEELIKRKRKQREKRERQLAAKEAAGDFSHLKNKGGAQAALPQPTLPTISLDDDEDDLKTVANSRYAASIRTGKESYWSGKDSDYKGGAYMPDYPPMPAYDPNAYPPQPGYAAYAVSLHDDASTLNGEHDDYASKAAIARGATPANASIHRGPTPANAYDAYGGAYGNNAYAQDQYRDRRTPDPYGVDYNGYPNQGYGNAYGGYGANQQQYQGYYDENAYYQQQQSQGYQNQQQPPPRQQPSRNGSKWEGGQAY